MGRLLGWLFERPYVHLSVAILGLYPICSDPTFAQQQGLPTETQAILAGAVERGDRALRHAAAAAIEEDVPPEPAPDAPEPEPALIPPDFETAEYNAQAGLGLVQASYAYARGASGKNVTVAVFDSGLDATHPEFDGQVVPGGFDFVLNTPTVTDPNSHGTHVSGIVGARKDDVGMHGIAYDARVLPIRIIDENGSVTVTDARLATAIDHAVANGAMVMNNSWGSPVAVTAVTKEEILAAIPQQVNAWGHAIDNDVVVVFASGNNFSLQPSVRAGLPFHFPEYQPLWLAVMAVELDGGDPAYSNACGVAAAWCLAAPGGGITSGNPGVFSTVPVSQGSYGVKSGTSMAAPHVSGAVAVLMEMFPELTSEQITARLLETADKSGIYADSSIFGQGLLDLDAATQPVGVAVILTGETTAGSAHPMSATSVHLGPAFGDGLKLSLQGAKLAVFDKHRATFFVDLGQFAQPSDSTTDVAALLNRFRAAPQRVDLGQGSYLSMRFSGAPDRITLRGGKREESRLESFSFTRSLNDSTEATVSHNRHPALSFGLHEAGIVDRTLVMSEGAFFAPYLTFADRGYNFAASTRLAELGAVRFGSFIGQQDGVEPSSDATGGIAELALSLVGRGELSAQLGALVEKDTILGSRTAGAFDTTSTPTFFGGLAGELKLTNSVSLLGGYFMGVSNPTPAGGSLFSNISSVRSNAFSLGLVGEDALSKGDRLGFVVNQPLRVTKAEATMALATGRTRAGTVLKREVEADMAPNGREIDLEVFYEARLGEQSTLGASAMLRMEPGHVGNADEEGVFLLKFSHKF